MTESKTVTPTMPPPLRKGTCSTHSRHRRENACLPRPRPARIPGAWPPYHRVMTYRNKTCKPLQQNFTQLKAQIHTNTAEKLPPTATKTGEKHKYAQIPPKIHHLLQQKTGEKHKSAQIPPKIHHLLQQNFTQLKEQIHTNTAENPPPTATKNRAASTDTARWWRP